MVPQKMIGLQQKLLIQRLILLAIENFFLLLKLNTSFFVNLTDFRCFDKVSFVLVIVNLTTYLLPKTKPSCEMHLHERS